MTLSRVDFVGQCYEFVERCRQFGDDWSLKKKRGDGQLVDLLATESSDACESSAELMLIKTEQKRISELGDGLLTFEYSVTFSDSYGVPVMYFCVSDQGGCPVPISSIVSSKTDDLSKVVNQVEHPLLFRPFYMIHPCRTEDFMRVHHKEDKSGYLISWLSVVGTLIGLQLDNRLAHSL